MASASCPGYAPPAAELAPPVAHSTSRSRESGLPTLGRIVLSEDVLRRGRVVLELEARGAETAADALRALKATAAAGPGGGGKGGLARMTVGTRVEALYGGTGSEWFAGVVLRCNVDGSYDVRYDDGDEEEGIGPGLVRPQADFS